MDPLDNTNAVPLTGIQLLLQASAAESINAETRLSTVPNSPTVQSSARDEPPLSLARLPDTALCPAAVSASLALSLLQRTPPPLSFYSPQFKSASSLILNRMRDSSDLSNQSKTTPGTAVVVPVSDSTLNDNTAVYEEGAGKAPPPPPPPPSSASRLAQSIPTPSARLTPSLKRKRSQSSIISGGSGSSIVSSSDTDPHESPQIRHSTREYSTKRERDEHVDSNLDTNSRRHRKYSTTSVVTVLCHECTKTTSHLLNRLVICTKCSKAWHQKCHRPEIRDGLLAVENASGRRQWRCTSCETAAASAHQDFDNISNSLPIMPLASTSSSQPRRICVVHDEGANKSPSTDGSFAMTERISWQDRSAKEKQKYLSDLPQADLVRLLTLSVQLHPDLPIFPRSSPRKASVAKENSFVRRLPPKSSTDFSSNLEIRRSSQAAPSESVAGIPSRSSRPNRLVEIGREKSTHNNRKKKQDMDALRNTTSASSSRKAAMEEANVITAVDTDDEDPTGLMETWPRPGHGLYTQLQPDKDDETMVEHNDYDAFSHIIYDGTGRKIIENNVPLLCR